MISVFHGNDNFKSRQNLLAATAVFERLNRFSPKEITSENLAKLTGSLFKKQNEAIVFENFFSLPAASLKKILPDVEKIEKDFPLFFWEEKELTPAKLNLLGKELKAVNFKTPALIFKFLDSLNPDNLKPPLYFFHELSKDQPAELIFFMLLRRIRELLAVKTDTNLIKGAPWQKSRLIAQAKPFALADLKKIYLNLIELDWRNKTGQLGISLESAMINWMLENKI